MVYGPKPKGTNPKGYKGRLPVWGFLVNFGAGHGPGKLPCAGLYSRRGQYMSYGLNSLKGLCRNYIGEYF